MINSLMLAHPFLGLCLCDERITCVIQEQRIIHVILVRSRDAWEFGIFLGMISKSFLDVFIVMVFH